MNQIYGSEARPSPEQEASFFGPMRLANGTYKTTRDHRLDDLNALLAGVLPEHRPLRVKDVGISSGVTTAEWADEFEASHVEFQMTGTDLFIDACLATVSSNIQVLFDARGNVLQIDLGHYGLRPAMVRSWRVLYGSLAAVLTLVARRRPCMRLRLLSPRLIKRHDIEILEEDLLAVSNGREWDVIRAANLLNLGYFPRETLQTMIAGLSSTLSTDGILAVCRTDPAGVNNATVFRCSATGLEIVGRLGAGSEVEHLVLDVANTV